MKRSHAGLPQGLKVIFKPTVSISPLRTAALGSFLFFVVLALWIRISSDIAGDTARSVEELKSIETYKGIASMFVTSVFFFLFSYVVFTRIQTSALRLVDSQRRLAETERNAIAGLIASSIAHDLSNLLTVLRINWELIKSSGETSPPAKDSLQRMDNGLQRMTELVARMRAAGHNVHKTRPLRYNVVRAVEDTLQFLKPHAALAGCTVQFLRQEVEIEAAGHPVLFHQLLMNLLINAAEATDGKGHIVVRVRREGDTLVLEVMDDGPGISPDLRGTVFEAFFTTKDNGTGLGLLSVKSCVDYHGGWTRIGDSELGGSVFTVYLPDVKDNQKTGVKISESLDQDAVADEPIAACQR